MGARITRREAAIMALLTEPTLAKAAESAGIGEKTLRRWLGKPDFQAEYRAARRRIVDVAIGRLQQASGEAVDTLQRNLTCDQPAVEVRAATTILEQAGRYLQIDDLEQRLQVLESLLEERQP
jgi:hypothetical protein